MKKVIVAATVVSAVVLASLNVSSKTTISKPVEAVKINKADFTVKGFVKQQKNDVSSVD